MEENTEKNPKNSRQKKKRKTSKNNIRINAAVIWIAIEAVAILVIAVLALVRTAYGESRDVGPTYTIPTEETSNIGVEDIELPTDLTKQTDDEEEYVVGDLYGADYSEEVMSMLSEMSLEQKVDMILATTPESLCDKSNVTIAGDVFKKAYMADPVSALFFTDQNFTSEADGMKMLATIRGWARDASGMNLLIGYWGDIADAAKQSERGINLYWFSADAEEAAAKSQTASDNNMVPVFYGSLSDLADKEEDSGFYIAESNDPVQIAETITAGKTFVYLTEDFKNVRDAIVSAVNDGTVPAEAVDKAAGYVITIRQALSEMRPEESEKEPPEEKPQETKKASTKTKTKTETKKLTPEEEAAAALKALQKQAEDAAKAAQKQLEEAAKAAAEQQGQ